MPMRVNSGGVMDFVYNGEEPSEEEKRKARKIIQQGYKEYYENLDKNDGLIYEEDYLSNNNSDFLFWLFMIVLFIALFTTIYFIAKIW